MVDYLGHFFHFADKMSSSYCSHFVREKSVMESSVIRLAIGCSMKRVLVAECCIDKQAC